MILLTLSTAVVLFIFYRRYFPVPDVHCISFEDIDTEKVNIVDVRDFNESYKAPIEGAINIPIAYLKRNYHEIPTGSLHIVGSSSIEKNMGIRFLKQKGFQIAGYTMMGPDKCLVKKVS